MSTSLLSIRITAMFSAISFVVVGIIFLPVGMARGQSKTVEEILIEWRANSFTNRDQTLSRLKTVGVQKAGDLIAYVETTNNSFRFTVLSAMNMIGNWDKQTITTVEKVALESEGVTFSLAASIIRNLGTREQRLSLALAKLDLFRIDMVSDLASWLSNQDQQWLAEDVQAQLLFSRLCARITHLLEKGPLTTEGAVFSVSASVMKPPFNSGACAQKITHALLAVLADESSYQPRAKQGRGILKDYDIVNAFAVVAANAAAFPELVEQGLRKMVTGESEDIARVGLWQVFANNIDESEIGRTVIAEALEKRPTLSDYVEKLRNTEFISVWPANQELAQSVSLTLRQLWQWPTNAFHQSPGAKSDN